MDKLCINVSRETMHTLSTYVERLLKWNRSVNLIAQSTINDVWERHINDSLQLQHHLPDKGHILDLGSGGGLPAIVLATLGYEVTCVESDSKKALFLEEMKHTLGISMHVKEQRIENLSTEHHYDVITSRACASLSQLLEWSYPHIQKNAFCLFLKGRNWRNEIDEAQGKWLFGCEDIQSVTEKEAHILKITQLAARI